MSGNPNTPGEHDYKVMVNLLRTTLLHAGVGLYQFQHGMTGVYREFRPVDPYFVNTPLYERGVGALVDKGLVEVKGEGNTEFRFTVRGLTFMMLYDFKAERGRGAFDPSDLAEKDVFVIAVPVPGCTELWTPAARVPVQIGDCPGSLYAHTIQNAITDSMDACAVMVSPKT